MIKIGRMPITEATLILANIYNLLLREESSKALFYKGFIFILRIFNFFLELFLPLFLFKSKKENFLKFFLKHLKPIAEVILLPL